MLKHNLHMRIIGILGGVASGKSMVAQQFARLGAAVLDADRAGHEALRLPQVEAAARRRWGEAVFGPDGRIDRTKLARIVFGREPEAGQERKYLEQLSHPEIGGLLGRQAEAFEAAGVVHTDFQRKFIRAEVVRFEDLAAAGSLAEARSRALLKLEGKEYVIRDGDVVYFRHSG